MPNWRHQVVSFGSINGDSPAFDADPFDHGLVHVDKAGACTVVVLFSPDGSSWHEFQTITHSGNPQKASYAVSPMGAHVKLNTNLAANVSLELIRRV